MGNKSVPLLYTAFAVLVSACANPGPVQLSPDTYMITRTDKGGVFGNASAMKAQVIADANQFAASKGKVAIPLSSRETPLVVGRGFASFEYQFRVVSPTDPEVRRVNLVPSPDVVIEKTEKSALDVTTKDKAEKSSDLYTELLKLDELRKRGILTDEEFEAQKRKLLSNP